MTCKVFCQTETVQEMTGVPDTGYAPFFFSGDGSTLPFRFTDASFTRVLSALCNGAYLTYGDDGRQVVWDFLVNVEFPLPFCAQIIDCIEHDGDVQEAMRNQLLGDPAFLQQLQDKLSIGTSLPTGTGGTTAPIANECDRNTLWAGCLGVIQQMNRNNNDFLEKMSALTEPTDRVSHLLGLVPVLGSIASDLLDFVNTLFTGITANYFAEYDTDYENEVTCQLFCLAISNCPDGYMSFEEIYNIFKDRLEASFTIESALLDVIQYLATGTWSGTQVCDFMFMFQMQAIRSGNKFLTSTLLSLQTMFEVGASVPSSAWIELCTDCPPEPTDTCLDFTTGKHGWDIYLAIGTYVGGSGFQVINSGGDYYLYTTADMDVTRLGTVSAVTLTFSAAVTNITFNAVGYSGSLVYSSAAATDITFDIASFPSDWVDFPFSSQMVQTSLNSAGMPSGALLVGICFAIGA